MTEANPREVIGGNHPPAESALEAWEAHAEDLRARSVGIVITNDEQAAKVAELVTDAKAALRDVGKAVTDERRPHTDAANAVSTSYEPVQSSITAVRDAAVKLSGAWRKKQEAAQRAAAAEAARIAAEADEKARKIAAEADETEADDLMRVREAEAAVKVTKMVAKKTRTAKVASGGVRMMQRAAGEIADHRAVWAHINKTAPDELLALLQGWVDGAVNAGARDIPGVNVREWQEAV